VVLFCYNCESCSWLMPRGNRTSQRKNWLDDAASMSICSTCAGISICLIPCACALILSENKKNAFVYSITLHPSSHFFSRRERPLPTGKLIPMLALLSFSLEQLSCLRVRHRWKPSKGWMGGGVHMERSVFCVYPVLWAKYVLSLTDNFH